MNPMVHKYHEEYEEDQLTPTQKSQLSKKPSIMKEYTPAICTSVITILLIINVYSGKLSVKQRRFIISILILIYVLMLIFYFFQKFKIKTFLSFFLIFNGLLLINQLIALVIYYRSENLGDKRKSFIYKIYELLYDREIIPISLSFIKFFTGPSLTFIITVYVIMILISIFYTINNLINIYKKSKRSPVTATSTSEKK